MTQPDLASGKWKFRFQSLKLDLKDRGDSMRVIQLFFARTIFVVILICLSIQSAWPENKKLIMGWESWPPFCYKDNKDNLVGLDIELITHILNEAGYSLEYEEIPWARSLKWLKDGEIHIAASASKSMEREAFAYFSEPYQKEAYLMFVRKGEASKYSLKSLKDIKGSSFRFGIMRESLYGDEFERLMKDPAFASHVEEVTTDEQNHRKLFANRFEGFIQEYSRMATDGREKGVFDKVEPLFVIEENQLHVMFSKQSTNPDIVNAFNSGLKKIMRDGTYIKIFRKYNLDKYNMINIGDKKNEEKPNDDGR